MIPMEELVAIVCDGTNVNTGCDRRIQGVMEV